VGVPQRQLSERDWVDVHRTGHDVRRKPQQFMITALCRREDGGGAVFAQLCSLGGYGPGG
jgi:hypothetical protein